MRRLIQTVALFAILTTWVVGMLLLADNEKFTCTRSIRLDFGGCFLREYKELSAALLGTAAAIIAAWIAFVGVKHQSKIAELAFWRGRLDGAELAVSGINFVRKECGAALDAFKNRDVAAQFSNADAALALQTLGLLDLTNWPPTGQNLLAWKANTQLTIIRVQLGKFFRCDVTSERERINTTLGTAFMELAQVASEADLELSKANDDRREAEIAIKRLV